MEEQPEPESLARLVGRNCKEIRKKIWLTQDDLARHARSFGLDWTQTRVGHFEAGRSAPTFTQMIAVTMALQAAVREYAVPRVSPVVTKVTLADLVRGTGLVALSDEISVPPADLETICSGKDPDGVRIFRRGDEPDGREGVWQILERSGLPEERLLRWLRDRGFAIDGVELAEVSSVLWRSTFSDERDRRAGPGVKPQKKGRVSRELRAELEKALADGNH